jgi:hypothetical protein
MFVDFLRVHAILSTTDFGFKRTFPGMLKDRLDKPIPYQEAAHILSPVARALAFAAHSLRELNLHWTN